MALKDFLLNIPTKIGNVTNKVGSTLGQALIGKQEPIVDYVNIKGVDVNSPEFAENAPIAEIGVTEAPRVGGLLNDIRSGAKENFATGFAAPNWEETTTPDGRKKGLGYRFGEGLGSFARFAESPLGRGLLMAGIVGASGGSGLEALGYGTGAGLLNQQSRMKDKMYRNELEKMGFDTTGIAGYVGDDTFNKIYQSKQLQDNAEYRNALLAGQRLEQDALIAQKQAELKHKQMSEAADRALKSRELDIKEKYYSNKADNNNKYKDDMANLLAIEGQLKNFEELFGEMPGKLKSYTVGKVQEKLGLQDATRAEFESRLNLLFNKISRDLGGEKGVLSNQDIERAMKASPTYYDNLDQKKAKMRAIYDLLELAKNKMAYKYGINAQNYTSDNNIQSTNEGWAF